MADIGPAADTVTLSDESRSPWGLLEAIAAFLISFVTLNIGAVVAVIISHNLIHHRLEFNLIAYQFLALGIVVSAVALILIRFHTGPAVLGFQLPRWQLLLLVPVFLVLIFVGVSIIYGLFNFVPNYHLHGNVRQLIPGRLKGRGEEVIVFLWAVVEAPLLEEILFRGIIYQGLKSFFSRWFAGGWSVFAGACISGCVFGLVHVAPETLPILIFVGIALAYVFEFTRTLYAPILVHAAINGIATIELFRTA